MPTYEYFCTHCNQIKEVVQRMTDEPLTSCPDCHKATISRRFSSSVGLHFKGSGFYSTDYGKSSSCCGKCGGNCSKKHH